MFKILINIYCFFLVLIVRAPFLSLSKDKSLINSCAGSTLELLSEIFSLTSTSASSAMELSLLVSELISNSSANSVSSAKII